MTVNMADGRLWAFDESPATSWKENENARVGVVGVGRARPKITSGIVVAVVRDNSTDHGKKKMSIIKNNSQPVIRTICYINI